MKVALYFSLIFFLFIRCKSLSDYENGFVLDGHTNGVKDSTLLFLSRNNVNIDSTFIIDNQFKFEGKLKGLAESFLLIRKDTPDFKSVWLEKGSMVLDASHTSLRESALYGSETQLLADSLKNLLDQAGRGLRRIRLEQKFVFDHPENVISAHKLAVYATSWGKETVQELYARFSDDLRASENGQKVKKYLDLVKAPQIGDRYADFSMTDTTGSLLKLSNHLSDLTLLEFWASWCGPCRAENPRLVKTYQKYAQQGFNVFAVSLDDDEKSWKKAIISDNLPWLQVSDLNGEYNEAALIYGIGGIPASYLIDREGTIIDRNLNGDDLEQRIESYLAEKAN